jgi:DNA-binding HxlR family transcriptional regulator
MSPGHTGHTARSCASADRDACPAVREVLSRVGDKWSVLVIGLLEEGPRRFSEIKRTIEGVSQRMLTLTLRNLERDGLLLRTVHPSVPPRVEYALTPLGRTLISPVRALALWAAAHRQEIQAARERHDRAAASTRRRA